MKFEDIKPKIKNLQIIGKGWRGIVYKGEYNSKILAFKVPRKKEYIKSIQKEANILKELNKHNIGNRLEIVGDDFIAYKFIDGIPFIKALEKQNSKELILKLFILARKLDKLGITKDEMHRPFKNVLVDNKGNVYLIDFEKAKYTEKPHNVTQLIHFVITYGSRYFKDIDKNQLIQLAKIYRNNPSEENFMKITGYLFKQHQL